MAKASHLVKETVMYSIHSETGAIITHRLPWERTSHQLKHYQEKGFTFEKPEVEALATVGTPLAETVKRVKKHRRKGVQ